MPLNNNFDYENGNYGNSDENSFISGYQARYCIFCRHTIGTDEYMKFNFNSNSKKFLVAHHSCFTQKCQDIGTTEDDIADFLDAFDIEVEY